MIYQIKTNTNTKGYRLRHATVTVCKDLSDVITIVYNGKTLDYSCHDRAKRKPEIVDAKQLGSKIDTIKEAEKFKPRADHPWRRYVTNTAKAAIQALTAH